jgi:hypothetical protein
MVQALEGHTHYSKFCISQTEFVFSFTEFVYLCDRHCGLVVRVLRIFGSGTGPTQPREYS